MVFHGLLHFIGFAREWNLGTHRPLSAKTFVDLSAGSSRLAGYSWLLAGLLFMTGAILYLLRNDLFWAPTAVALLISQALIIIYWDEARYGTAINVMILMVVIHGVGVARFNSHVNADVDRLHRQAASTSRTVTDEMIAPLPDPVQRWLRTSGVVGKAHPNTLRIEQRGTLRLKPNGRWLPFRAVQHFSIDPPSFVWQAQVRMAPLVTIAAHDRYVDGHGQMLIKPLYFFTAANSSGAEVDQGTLVRYMAEMAWFPQAATNSYLHWQAVNEHQAKVTMEYNGISASGLYTFDEDGNVTSFEALRYGDFDGTYRQEPWQVSVTGYKNLGGRRLGSSSELTWKLPEGDFKWLRVEVIDVRESRSR